MKQTLLELGEIERLFAFIFLSFWAVSILAQILKILYIAQLKEYRFDRFLAYLKSHEFRNMFFTRFFFLYIFVLFFSIFTHYIFPFFRILSDPFLIIYFPLFYCFVLYDHYKGRLIHPVWTKKTLSLILTIFLTQIAFLYDLFDLSYVPQDISFRLFIYNLFLPFITVFWIIVFQIFTRCFKSILYIRASHKMAAFSDLIVIGITGSFGKSSTKEFLASILNHRFRVLKTEANINSEIGVARTVLKKLRKNFDIFVVEMGAYKKGEIATMCKIVKPKIGILTSISAQHLSLFGSLDELKKAKYELIDSLPEDGIALFNGDNSECMTLYEKTRHKKAFYSYKGISEKPTPNGHFHPPIYASHAYASQKMIHFTVHVDKNFPTIYGPTTISQSQDFAVRVPGIHNISNLLAAISASLFLGMNIREIQTATKNLPMPEHTLKILDGIHGSLLIDDSYSANPDGVLAALDYLQGFDSGKKIMVLRSMIELGDTANEAHRRVGEKIGQVCDFFIMTTVDYFDTVKCAAIVSGMSEHNIFLITQPSEIIKTLRNIIQKGDTILLENRIHPSILASLRV